MPVAKIVSMHTSHNGHLVSMDGKIIYDIADGHKNINYVCLTNITVHHDKAKHFLYVDLTLYDGWCVIFIDEAELNINSELKDVVITAITKEVEDRWNKEIKAQLIEQKRQQLDQLLSIINRLQEDLESDQL